MILIGQYDSPFTRRVAITMRFYGLAFEHNPLSVFGNADELAAVNPLIRVPTLVLDSGEALIETSAIIDYLDSLVATDKRLLPQAQPARYRALNIVNLASGISDMAVRLFYELRLHDQPAPGYVARLTRQIDQALAALEKTLPLSNTPSQPEIAVACMYRHLSECHPQIAAKEKYPKIETHCVMMEALPDFFDVSQAFIAPA